MREDKYWISDEGELKRTNNWTEEIQLLNMPWWTEISSEEYAHCCQAVIYAMKNNVIND